MTDKEDFEKLNDIVCKNFGLNPQAKLVGAGEFSRVVAVKGLDNQDYALKILDSKKNSFFNREWETTQKIRGKSKNLIQVYERMSLGDEVYVKMEYANSGSIDKVFVNSGMTLDTIDLLWQLFSGIQVLQKNNLVHRDLKPDNILLHEELTGGKKHLVLKIADFGFCRGIDKNGKVATCLGAPLYMAPEMFSANGGYTNKVDIWSVGLIFYQLMNKGVHVCGKDCKKMSPYQIVDTCKKPLVRPVSLTKAGAVHTAGYITDTNALDACWELLQQMLCVNPILRTSAAECLRSPLFARWGPPQAQAQLCPPPPARPYIPPVYPLSAGAPVLEFGAGMASFPTYMKEYDSHQHDGNIFEVDDWSKPAKTEGVGASGEVMNIRHQVVFLMDATGSMMKYIDAVRTHIKNVVAEMHQRSTQEIKALTVNLKEKHTLSFEISSLCYRDFKDTKHFETLDFTESSDRFSSFLSCIKADGGDDEPEDILGAFLHALYGLGPSAPALSWDARGPVAKQSIILVADAPGHGFTKNKDEFPNAMLPYWEIVFRTLRCKEMSLAIVKVNNFCTVFHDKMMELGEIYGVEVNVIDINDSLSGSGGGGGSGSSSSSSSSSGSGGEGTAKVSSDLKAGLDKVAVHLSGIHSLMSVSMVIAQAGRYDGPADVGSLIEEIFRADPDAPPVQFVETFKVFMDRKPTPAEAAQFLKLANIRKAGKK